jgi:hypothetical protein
MLNLSAHKLEIELALHRKPAIMLLLKQEIQMAANSNVAPLVFRRELTYSDSAVYARVERRFGSDVIAIWSDDNLIAIPAVDLENFIAALRQQSRP